MWKDCGGDVSCFPQVCGFYQFPPWKISATVRTAGFTPPLRRVFLQRIQM
jgi:hypothetical protein